MYPKTKREAIERLIEKVEGALDAKLYEGVIGGVEDCPLCQWAFRHSNPSWDDTRRGSLPCTRCKKAFGTPLGFREPDDRCGEVSLKGTSIAVGGYHDATSRQQHAFLTALLPVLKQMLAEVK